MRRLHRELPVGDAAIALLHGLFPAGVDRLSHSLGVGRRAESVAQLLPAEDRDLLVAAGYLHDIGYADGAVGTGLHQLDGARYARGLGYDDELSRLVAHHSFAEIEARNKGYADTLDREFPAPTGRLATVLELVTYCDMTASSSGDPVTVDQRFAGIYSRYEQGHVVARSMRQAEPLVRAIVSDVDERLAARFR
ncbi:HD domain-containing protein [Myceligenerans crystallogenes]|uniref:HDIG domain-containing protein n=1 Tax=Myceligenerans crystallogenes TaxID=316335 RepID=A0ABN2NAD7_9MICO